MKYNSSSTTGWMVGGIAILIILFIAWASRSSTTSDYSKKSNREIALLCTTDMATKFHIHADLKIVINSQAQTIPANTGILPACMNSIHTHDDSGKLHVEAPEKRDFTLADFFAVWNKPFSQNEILDYKADANHQIRETVNGQESSDFENTVLRDDDQIIIYYEAKNTL